MLCLNYVFEKSVGCFSLLSLIRTTGLIRHFIDVNYLPIITAIMKQEKEQKNYRMTKWLTNMDLIRYPQDAHKLIRGSIRQPPNCMNIKLIQYLTSNEELFELSVETWSNVNYLLK